MLSIVNEHQMNDRVLMLGRGHRLNFHRRYDLPVGQRITIDKIIISNAWFGFVLMFSVVTEAQDGASHEH